MPTASRPADAKPERARVASRKLCPVKPIPIEAMDVARVATGLYQGGLHAFDGCQIAISGVNAVVKLTDDCRVRILWPDLINFPLEDEVEDLRFIKPLWALAGRIAKRLKKGDKVAIFCRMGRNRSGLLTGLTLHRLYGWSGDRIVKHLRKHRDGALEGGGGDYFAEWMQQNL